MFEWLFFELRISIWSHTELIVATVLESNVMYVKWLDYIYGKNFAMKTVSIFDEFEMRLTNLKEWVNKVIIIWELR